MGEKKGKSAQDRRNRDRQKDAFRLLRADRKERFARLVSKVTSVGSQRELRPIHSAGGAENPRGLGSWENLKRTSG